MQNFNQQQIFRNLIESQGVNNCIFAVDLCLFYMRGQILALIILPSNMGCIQEKEQIWTAEIFYP
jgi:hypothetical protein